MSQALLYGLIAIICLVVEVYTVNLVSLWFVIGAGIVAVANLFVEIPPAGNALGFLLISALIFLLFYRPLKEYFLGVSDEKKEEIFPAKFSGKKLRVQGVLYDFQEIHGEEIAEGDLLRTCGNRSTVLLVEKISPLEAKAFEGVDEERMNEHAGN